MNSIRLALIEDDPEVRELQHSYLCCQPKFDCVAIASSVEDFLAELPDLLHPPQMLLLDVQLPGLSGIEVLPLLMQKLPQVDIVMQTVFDDADRIYQALCRGASGYVLKNTPLAELKAAVLEVAQGGAPMSRRRSPQGAGPFQAQPHRAARPAYPPRARRGARHRGWLGR